MNTPTPSSAMLLYRQKNLMNHQSFNTTLSEVRWDEKHFCLLVCTTVPLRLWAVRENIITSIKTGVFIVGNNKKAENA